MAQATTPDVRVGATSFSSAEAALEYYAHEARSTVIGGFADIREAAKMFREEKTADFIIQRRSDWVAYRLRDIYEGARDDIRMVCKVVYPAVDRVSIA